MADKDDRPDWQLTPEEADQLPPGPSQRKMHRAGRRAESRQHWAAGNVSPAEDRRFAGPSGMRLFWKPPLYTFGAGGPAVLLIVCQLWLPNIDAALGDPLGSYVGLGRLGMILLGALLLFVAAPLHKPADWTPEKQQEIDSAREYFRGKRHT